MYVLEKFDQRGALVTNNAFLYNSTFIAETAADAEKIVIGLNQVVMLAELAAHRFSFEVAGLQLAGGMQVKTDRESQSQLSNCFVDLKHGLIPDTDWKGSQWQLVDLQQIEPIAKAVAAHRRGCFRGERLVQTAINEASSMDDIEAIDIPAMFASAYQDAYAEVMTPEQAAE